MPFQLAGRLATRDTALGERCPVDRAMRAIGNRAALLLVREAFYGATRFDDLAARVGLTDAAAAQRLKGQRTRHEYVLTEAGHDLVPVVLALGHWGARHVPGGAPTLTHDGCGEAVELVVRCRAGHEVAEDDLVVTGRA